LEGYSTHANVAQVTTPASNGEGDFKVTYCQDDDLFTGCTPTTIGNRGTCTDGVVKDYGDLEPSSSTTYYDDSYRDCDTGNPSNIRSNDPYNNGNYLRIYYEDMGWSYGKYQICVNYTTSTGLNADPVCMIVIDEYEDITQSGISSAGYQTGSTISWTGTVTDRYDTSYPQDNFLERKCKNYPYDYWHNPTSDDGLSVDIRRHSTWENYWAYFYIYAGTSSSSGKSGTITINVTSPQNCYLRDRDGDSNYAFYHNKCGWFHGVDGNDGTWWCCPDSTWKTSECTNGDKYVVTGQYGGSLTIYNQVTASGGTDPNDNYDYMIFYLECPNGETKAFANTSDPYTITVSGHDYLWVNNVNYGGSSFSEPLWDSVYTANYDFTGANNNEYSCSIDTDGFCGPTQPIVEFYDHYETYGSKRTATYVDEIYLNNMGLSGSSNTLTPSFDLQYCSHDTRNVRTTCELNDDTPDTSGDYCQYTGAPGTSKNCAISNPSCTGGTNTVYCAAQDPTYTNIHQVTQRSYNFAADDAQQWCDACGDAWMTNTPTSGTQCCGDDGASDDSYYHSDTPSTATSLTCERCLDGSHYAATTLYGNGYTSGTTCYYGDITCTAASGANGTLVKLFCHGLIIPT